jgi:hypothetical protein
MEGRERVGRRELFSLVVSGLATAAAACGPAGAATTVVNTPEGRVLQWEREGMTVLVSTVREEYRAGEPMRLDVLLNNGAPVPAVAKVRARLLGRGQQAVVEAEVANVTVNADSAVNVDRTLDLPRSLAPGDYTIVIELPPWRLERREVGGGRLNADVRVTRAM